MRQTVPEHRLEQARLRTEVPVDRDARDAGLGRHQLEAHTARGHATGAPPDADGFEKLEALAPDEVRGDVSAAARLFRQQGSEAFDDPEFQRIELAIEDWEAENCHDADASD